MSPRPSGAAKTARIRALNDAFRAMPAGVLGQMVLTAGIASLGDKARAAVLERVMRFDAFTEDNDPHGEHDFGAFDCDGVRYFWKIDYYDVNLKAHSPHPSDPSATKRVLTVMRADEY